MEESKQEEPRKNIVLKKPPVLFKKTQKVVASDKPFLKNA